jgi:uncharacterized protein (TIGR00369 family)
MPNLNPTYLTLMYEIVNTSPFPRHLPMRIVSMSDGASRIELDIDTVHLQPFGIVHGGVIATLIDTATFWAAFSSISEDDGLVNVDLKLNYLAVARSGRLAAEGRSIKSGRTISYAEASVRADDGSLIAHGTSTLMVLPGKGIKVGVPKFLS